MTHIARLLTLVLVILFACTAALAACAPANEAALTAAPEPTPAATATPTQEPTPSPVPPESLTYKQKSDMIWTGEYPHFIDKTSSYYILYLEHNGQGRLVWVEKEYNAPDNEFDLLDVFNDVVLFHVSIPSADQAKVTPSEFPKYIVPNNESLRQYSVVAAGELLDINDLYANCNIDFTAADTPYDVLYPHFYLTPDGISYWSREKMLNAYIDVTPAQYILPIWEYVPYAATPDSYFNPPSPTPVLTPMPDSYREQMLQLLGIDEDFEEVYMLDDIEVYYYSLNGSKRIIWTRSYYGSPNGTVDVHSLFNNEYLFSWYVDPENRPENLSCSDEWKYHSASSQTLEGVRLLGSGTLSDLIINYEQWGIAYHGNKLLDKLRYDSWYDWEAFSTDSDLSLIKDEIIDLYLELTPTDYIPPFWEYVPNAVTPDGFPTPAP